MANQEAPARRKRWRIAIVLVLIVLASLAMLYWFAFLNGWTVAKLERLLPVELPVGKARVDVEAWLNKHSIKHMYMDDVSKNRLDGQTVPERAGLSGRDLSGMVEGFIPDASVNPIYEGHILIYFFFDRQGRLIGQFVYPLVTDRSHLLGLLVSAPSHEPAAK